MKEVKKTMPVVSLATGEPEAKQEKTATEKYDAVNKQWIEMRTEQARLTRPLLEEFARDLFSRCPYVNSFGWHQYHYYEHPDYFCLDHVYINGIHLAIPGDDEYVEALRYKEAGQIVSRILNKLDEKDLEELYGDEMLVTYHRDGRVTTVSEERP